MGIRMNNEQDFGVSQIIRGRAAFYEFLSYTLQKPMDKDALEIIKEFAPYFEAVAAETDVADLKEGSSRLTSFIAKSDDNGAFYDMLNGSYSTLFLLGGKSIPTTESVWLSPEKL
jgi:hypothetical protein